MTELEAWKRLCVKLSMVGTIYRGYSNLSNEEFREILADSESDPESMAAIRLEVEETLKICHKLWNLEGN